MPTDGTWWDGGKFIPPGEIFQTRRLEAQAGSPRVAFDRREAQPQRTDRKREGAT